MTRHPRRLTVRSRSLAGGTLAALGLALTACFGSSRRAARTTTRTPT